MIKGTLLNTLFVFLGSLCGIFLKKFIPEKITSSIISIIGIITLVIGFKSVILSDSILLMIISILFGFIAGELLNIEEKINNSAELVKKYLKSKNPHFTEGITTAFLIFCVGSMTILGAMEEGIKNNPSILYVKSILDLITSTVLASTLGWGVFFSAFPLFIFQTILTLSASHLKMYIETDLINGISATGGIILIALGLNLLELKKIKTSNMLPALFIYPILYFISKNIQFF